MIGQDAIEAVETSDLDGLTRIVDTYCGARRWDDLLDLKQRCREAVGRGKQLWGVEEHIRYRLALEGPAETAANMVMEGPARFSLGPLTEVVASANTWGDLAAHLPPGPERQTIAAERVIRGETGIGPIPDLPDRLEAWEPRYETATYHADKVDTPSPPVPGVSTTPLPEGGEVIEDPESEAALADLVHPWTAESDGRCQTVAVYGNGLAAIRALGVPVARTGEIEPAHALAWMAWAGASGGAHGRRRGTAAGRAAAWWAVASVGDLHWPPDPDQVGDMLTGMTWTWFDDGAPATGWALRLAVADPGSGLAWAISAIDSSA